MGPDEKFEKLRERLVHSMGWDHGIASAYIAGALHNWAVQNTTVDVDPLDAIEQQVNNRCVRAYLDGLEGN